MHRSYLQVHRRRTFIPAILLLIQCLLIATHAYAVSPSPQAIWQTLETPHFFINHTKENQQQAQRLAIIAESVYPGVTDFLSWQPVEKTNINLFDYTNDPHGWADVTPYSIAGIFITPPESGELLTSDDWLRLVFTHEFIHIVHLEKFLGTPAGMQQLFGRHRWLFPNRFQPAWLTEGLATYGETLFSPQGGGRSESPLFEAMMRQEINHGLMPLSQINASSNTWPLNSAYLYGSYFYLFMETVYGEQIANEWINDYSNNLIPYRIVSSPTKSTGKSLAELWQDYENWLQQRFQPQIERIQQQGIVRGEALSNSGYFSSSPTQNTMGELFFVENDGRSHPHIVKVLANGSQHRLVNVHGNARIDSHAEKGLLIAQPAVCDPNHRYFDLFHLPVGNTSVQRLTQCARYKLASWHPKTNQIATVKVEHGLAHIELLSSDGSLLERLHTGNYTEVINSIDWSPDGNTLVVSRKVNNQWDLYQFAVDSKQWIALSTDPAIQSDVRFSDDGRHLIYSSNRDGLINLELLDLSDNTVHVLTSQIGAAIQPSGYGKSGLLGYVSIDNNGQDIYRLGLAHTNESYQLNITSNSQTKRVQTLSSLPKGQSNLSSDDNVKDAYDIKPYRPLSTLTPTYWEPNWQTEDGDSTAVGFYTEGRDALGIHHYGLRILKETDLDEYFGHSNYLFDQRLYLSLKKELSVLLTDDSKPIIYKTSTEYQMLYTFPSGTLDQHWQIGPAYSFERVKMKSRRHSLSTARENVLGIHFRYRNTEQLLLTHGVVRGRSVDIVLEDYELLDNDFTDQVYTIDWHEYLDLGNSTLALRFVQGWGTGKPTLFELGGVFSENENSAPRINQRDYSLRGYRNHNDILSGRRMRLGTIEWRLPINMTSRTLMVPPIGIGKTSAVTFIDSGATWTKGSSPQQYYSASGVEFIAEIIFGYNLVLDTRLGFAHGYDDIGENRVYVRFGRAF